MSLPSILVHFLRRYFPHGPKTMAEIGAADGEDTATYLTIFPRAAVHAFEPLARNLPVLERAITPRPNATVHPFALSDVNDTAVFYESHGSAPNGIPGDWNLSSSLLRPEDHRRIHPWCTFTEAEVETRRYDSLGLPSPEYVHMDVQGAELKVLRGMGVHLHDVKAVWLEVSNIELYAGQPLCEDVLRFMTDHRFTCRIDGLHESAPSGDQLWVRR